MPIGNCRKWVLGSLFFLGFAAACTKGLAAYDPPSGEMLQTAPSASAPQVVPDDTKYLGAPSGAQPSANPEQGKSALGVLDESQPQPVPATSSPTTDDGECGSICGMPICSPPGRFWLRTDAMLWWTNGIHLPPLVTSNSAGNAPIIGQPGTEIVFGSDNFLNEEQNAYLRGGRGGARITLGGWLDRCHRWGVEADWLTLSGLSTNYSNFSNGNPATGRPFFNVEPTAIAPPTGSTTTSGGPAQGESAEIVAMGDISGTVTVHAGDSFDAAGFMVRYNLCCCGGCDPCGDCGTGGCGGGDCNVADACNLCMNYCRTDFLFGYRHYALRDGVTITESLDDRTPGVDRHTDIADNFSCHNDFNGVDLGLNSELRRGRWSLNILAKMAFGTNQQTTMINGTTANHSLVGPLDPHFYPVGIYAVAPNSGTFTQNDFAVIPQFGLEIGYQLTCHVRTYIGYNILYWANVMRAGEQIDRNIDPRNWAAAPDAENALPFPQFLDRGANFWAQGINLGAEIRF
jgi:hypothetical protein